MSDVPELLFKQCRENLNDAYSVAVEPKPAATAADGSVEMGKEISANPSTRPQMDLPKTERLVAETCAKDMARMQALPMMYKSYREFILVHGGQGRDEPQNLRKGEVSYNLHILSISNVPVIVCGKMTDRWPC